MVYNALAFWTWELSCTYHKPLINNHWWTCIDTESNKPTEPLLLSLRREDEVSLNVPISIWRIKWRSGHEAPHGSEGAPSSELSHSGDVGPLCRYLKRCMKQSIRMTKSLAISPINWRTSFAPLSDDHAVLSRSKQENSERLLLPRTPRRQNLWAGQTYLSES